MFRKKAFWISLLAVILIGAGGYAGYAYWLAPQEEAAEETVLETASVTVGDLSITADGTGVLVASSEVDLAFDASGTVMELLVAVGDQLAEGAPVASTTRMRATLLWTPN